MQTQTHEPAPSGAASAYLLASGMVCLRSQLPLISDDAPIRWVHVAYEGEWRGHNAGRFQFTRERFAQAIANFERQKNAAKLDFDHETDYAPPGSSVPARGWVHRLEIRDEGGIAHLYALTEFGAEAVRKNREGGYRFCSGVFDFNAVDRVSGEPCGLAMLRLALTDDPFIDGQQPILLSRAAPLALNGETMKIDKAEFVRRLRKLEGDEVSAEQISKLAQAMALMDEATGGGSGGDAPAEGAPETPAAMSADTPAEPVAAASPAAPEAPSAEPDSDEATEADSLAAQLMEATGMTMEQLIAALQSLASGGDEMPAATAPLSAKLEEQAVLLSAHTKTIAALSARAETAEAEVKRYRETEADKAVDVLISTGRILDNARDEMRGLYLSNRKAFDTLAAALPEVVPVGEHASGQTPPTEETPAIDENDPFVKSRRRLFANTWLPKAEQDAAIIRDMKARKNNGTRV